MRIRQEPLVFLVAALGLGGMSYRLLNGGATSPRGGERSSAAGERKHFRAPDPAVALPNGNTPGLARELFVPPRDTAPLPPLELVEPPRERLTVLLPPTDPGPAPKAYGKLLRQRLSAVDLPDLFVKSEDEPASSLEDQQFLDLGGKEGP